MKRAESEKNDLILSRAHDNFSRKTAKMLTSVMIIPVTGMKGTENLTHRAHT